MSFIKHAIMPLALMVATPLSAASVTLDFPSASSTSTGSGANSQFFFSPAHTVTESFTGTGIADATMFSFDLFIKNINLKDGAFVTFEARTNMTVLGNFTFSEGDADGLYSFDFAFADPDPIGDDYSIGLFVTNTVPAGDGSIELFAGASTVTISDEAGVNVVPLPATGLLLGAGLLGLGAARRKS